MKQGQIKDLQGHKGFGFIMVKGDTPNYFFHRDDFMGHWGDLTMDYLNRMGPMQVSFDPDMTEKGPRARNVRRTEWPNEG